MESNNKYQNGKIYKIVDKGYTKCYIGSTVERLSTRMAKHRDNFLKQRYPIYSRIMFNEFGIDNCKIELVENYPCNSREELNAREGYHIKNSVCVNKLVAGRTTQEYRLEHREQKSTYDKEYTERTKEHRAVQRKMYRENHKQEISEKAKEKVLCECGCQVARNTLPRHMRSDKHKHIISKQLTI